MLRQNISAIPSPLKSLLTAEEPLELEDELEELLLDDELLEDELEELLEDELLEELLEEELEELGSSQLPVAFHSSPVGFCCVHHLAV